MRSSIPAAVCGISAQKMASRLFSGLLTQLSSISYLGKSCENRNASARGAFRHPMPATRGPTANPIEGNRCRKWRCWRASLERELQELRISNRLPECRERYQAKLRRRAARHFAGRPISRLLAGSSNRGRLRLRGFVRRRQGADGTSYHTMYEEITKRPRKCCRAKLSSVRAFFHRGSRRIACPRANRATGPAPTRQCGQ